MTTNKELRELAEKATKGPWMMREVENQGAIAHKDGWVLDADDPADDLQDQRFIAAANPATVLVLLDDIEALQAECEQLRKDAERYRYIKKGNQWIVAATQTGFQLDGEELDELIDSEMERQT